MLFHIVVIAVLVLGGAYLQYRFNIAKYVGLTTPKTN